MSITVKPENEAYLKRLVADGQYASIEEAADAAIETLRMDDQDLSWAKPYVDKALASLDLGKGISMDEAFGQVHRHIATRQS